MRPVLFKSLFIAAVLSLVYCICGWFSEPQACTNTTRLIVFLTGFGAKQFYPEKIAKAFAGVSAMLALVLACYHLDFVHPQVFVLVFAVLLAVICVLVALMSVFVGKPSSMPLQQALVLISFLAPFGMLGLYFVSGNYVLFQFGVLVSISASALNIFFNKTSNSFALPGATQTSQKLD
mmetsp:Transcript_17643/g.34444  ORF Transcript_17643/g.34444 Transcript_17643/m.34444 type:complete len:178 (+) Transcript_17643:173-706(+)